MPPVEFDNRKGSYGNFVNNEDTKRLRLLAKDTKIHDAVDRLLAGWEALSSIRALPSILNNIVVRQFHESSDHYLKNNEVDAKSIVRLAIKRMKKESKSPLNSVQEANLKKCISNIVGEQRNTNTIEESEEELWQKLVGIDPVQNLLFVSQRVVVANLYSLYEVCAQDMLRLNTNLPSGNLDSMKRMKALLNELALTEDKLDCIYSEDVRIVKDLRDSFLHSGCLPKVSFERDKKSGLMKLHQHDGTVFITPRLVDVYFQRLWESATFIIETAVRMQKYKS